VKKLRAVTEHVAAAMERFRREYQAKQVVAWLHQAHGSKGKRRPVLAVGRDGITLQTRPHSPYEVATTATLNCWASTAIASDIVCSCPSAAILSSGNMKS
jgi:hypothetical protein